MEERGSWPRFKQTLSTFAVHAHAAHAMLIGRCPCSAASTAPAFLLSVQVFPAFSPMLGMAESDSTLLVAGGRAGLCAAPEERAEGGRGAHRDQVGAGHRAAGRLSGPLR